MRSLVFGLLYFYAHTVRRITVTFFMVTYTGEGVSLWLSYVPTVKAFSYCFGFVLFTHVAFVTQLYTLT